MTNNSLAFWPGHCTHIRVTSPTTMIQPRLLAETAVIKIEKDITP